MLKKQETRGHDVPVPRELRRAKQAALKAGWTLRRTVSGHHVWWCPPSGPRVLTRLGSGGHSSGHTTANYIAQLRRGGLEIS